MRRFSFTQSALLVVFVSFVLSSCTARPLVEEKDSGLFSGPSGEYVIYEDGERRRK